MFCLSHSCIKDGEKEFMFFTTFFEVDFGNIKDIYGSLITFNFHKVKKRLKVFMENAIVNTYHYNENSE